MISLRALKSLVLLVTWQRRQPKRFRGRQVLNNRQTPLQAQPRAQQGHVSVINVGHLCDPENRFVGIVERVLLNFSTLNFSTLKRVEKGK
jgi:hypothetical protein